jgi:hypothetical protein
MTTTKCEECNETVESYDIINYGSMDTGYRKICTRCFNADVAKRHGLVSFENLRLDPIGIVDCSGETHQFHFRTRLLGPMVVLEAFELRDGNPGGYEFEVIGEPADDLFMLLKRMIERIRRTLSVKHIEEDERHGLQIKDMTVRGRIEWDDEEDGRVPVVVVDGREISWDQFGEMMMSYEGWQFKLEILDRSDEI